MEIETTHCKLYEFISIANRENIEFAKYIHDCSARDFVLEIIDDHPTTGEQIRTYTFKDFYLKPSPFTPYNYHVLAILGTSYLMYEISDEIFIWACYTEENSRGNGYISTLLKNLKEIYPEKVIKTHTDHESLKKICLRFGIELLPF